MTSPQQEHSAKGAWLVAPKRLTLMDISSAAGRCGLTVRNTGAETEIVRQRTGVVCWVVERAIAEEAIPTDLIARWPKACLYEIKPGEPVDSSEVTDDTFPERLRQICDGSLVDAPPMPTPEPAPEPAATVDATPPVPEDRPSVVPSSTPQTEKTPPTRQAPRQDAPTPTTHAWQPTRTAVLSYFQAIGLSGVLTALCLVFAFVSMGRRGHGHSVWPWVVLLFVAFASALFVASVYGRCPHCDRPVNFVAGIRCCPYCGNDLDPPELRPSPKRAIKITAIAAVSAIIGASILSAVFS